MFQYVNHLSHVSVGCFSTHDLTTFISQDTEKQRIVRDEGHSGGRRFGDLLRLGEGCRNTEVPEMSWWIERWRANTVDW